MSYTYNRQGFQGYGTNSTSGYQYGFAGNRSLNQLANIDPAEQPMDTVTQLVFSEQKNYLACASWDGTCRIWDFGENFQDRQRPFIYRENSKDTVLRCSFGSDYKTFYIGNTKGEIKEISVFCAQSEFSHWTARFSDLRT